MNEFLRPLSRYRMKLKLFLADDYSEEPTVGDFLGSNFWHRVRLRIRDGIKGVAPSKFLNLFSFEFFFFFFFVSLIYNRKINLLCLSISTIIIYNIFRTLFVRRYTYLWSVKIAKKKIIKILLKRMELYSHVAPPFHIFRNGIVTVLFDRSIKFSAPLGPTNYETLTRSFIDRWTFCYISFAAFFLYTDINDNLLEIDNSSAL